MPPWVVMMMSDFAFGGSMGALGASKLCGSAPASLNAGANAAAARLIAMNFRREISWSGSEVLMASVDVDKFIRVKNHVAKISERGVLRIDFDLSYESLAGEELQRGCA